MDMLIQMRKWLPLCSNLSWSSSSLYPKWTCCCRWGSGVPSVPTWVWSSGILCPSRPVVAVEEVATPLFLPELVPGLVCVLDVEEVASPLFLPELAAGIFCVLDVEKVASPLFLPELAPGIVCVLDVEEVTPPLFLPEFAPFSVS